MVWGKAYINASFLEQYVALETFKKFLGSNHTANETKVLSLALLNF